jgi:hypothetical protein
MGDTSANTALNPTNSNSDENEFWAKILVARISQCGELPAPLVNTILTNCEATTALPQNLPDYVREWEEAQQETLPNGVPSPNRP